MIRTVLPWATSAGTLLGMWLLSHKRWEGWVVGLVNQVLWVATSIVYGTWGFLVLTAALVVIYTRGLLRWRRDERGARCEVCRQPVKRDIDWLPGDTVDTLRLDGPERYVHLACARP